MHNHLVMEMLSAQGNIPLHEYLIYLVARIMRSCSKKGLIRSLFLSLQLQFNRVVNVSVFERYMIDMIETWTVPPTTKMCLEENNKTLVTYLKPSPCHTGSGTFCLKLNYLSSYATSPCFKLQVTRAKTIKGCRSSIYFQHSYFLIYI